MKDNDKNYLFVDNIRFISMGCIIALHTHFFPLSVTNFASDVVVMQAMKFGTICFYIIGGFLLGTKLETGKPIDYFKRRLDSTALPWLFWFFAYNALLVGSLFVRAQASVQAVLSTGASTLLYTNYWFVPNFLFALGILLAFRKYFLHAWFGIFWFLVSMLYGINLYFKWMPTEHTAAIFGFVFYLWLGYYISTAQDRVLTFIHSLNWAWLGITLAASFALALVEAKMLAPRTGNFLNTIRISNQVYSLVVFFSLLKIKRRVYPRWMNVQRHTFGLYLTHTVVYMVIVAALVHFLARVLNISGSYFYTRDLLPVANPALRILIWIAAFGATYSCSWMITSIIAISRFHSVVGAKETDSKSRPISFPHGLALLSRAGYIHKSWIGRKK